MSNFKEKLHTQLVAAGASDGLLAAANEFAADNLESFSDYIVGFAQFLTLGGSGFVTGDDLPVLEKVVAENESVEIASSVEDLVSFEPITQEEMEATMGDVEPAPAEEVVATETSEGSEESEEE